MKKNFERKANRKAPEPLAFSCATNACGAVVLTGIADLLDLSLPNAKKQNEERCERWDAEREDWKNQGRQWNENK